MAFLTKAELKTVADVTLVDKITNTDDTIVTAIIDESISIMTTYLKPRYDTDTIFAQTGSNRHLTVLKYLKDIVVFEIYIRYTRGKEANEVAMLRYQQAMKWLEDVNTGKLNADLPLPEPTDPATISTIAYGSSTKYTTTF